MIACRFCSSEPYSPSLVRRSCSRSRRSLCSCCCSSSTELVAESAVWLRLLIQVISLSACSETSFRWDGCRRSTISVWVPFDSTDPASLVPDNERHSDARDQQREWATKQKHRHTHVEAPSSPLRLG